MIEQVKQVAADVEGGANRMDLLDLLPPGGGRCAIDSRFIRRYKRYRHPANRAVQV